MVKDWRCMHPSNSSGRQIPWWEVGDQGALIHLPTLQALARETLQAAMRALISVWVIGQDKTRAGNDNLVNGSHFTIQLHLISNNKTNVLNVFMWSPPSWKNIPLLISKKSQISTWLLFETGDLFPALKPFELRRPFHHSLINHFLIWLDKICPQLLSFYSKGPGKLILRDSLPAIGRRVNENILVCGIELGTLGFGSCWRYWSLRNELLQIPCYARRKGVENSGSGVEGTFGWYKAFEGWVSPWSQRLEMTEM